MVSIKRVYEPALPSDGERYLVARLWPRRLRREDLQLSGWLRQAGPSDALRGWFGHDPARWEAFCQRYFAELEANPAAWQPLLEAARRGPVTLLFAARDAEHNNAAALKQFLEGKLRES